MWNFHRLGVPKMKHPSQLLKNFQKIFKISMFYFALSIWNDILKYWYFQHTHQRPFSIICIFFKVHYLNFVAPYTCYSTDTTCFYLNQRIQLPSTHTYPFPYCTTTAPVPIMRYLHRTRTPFAYSGTGCAACGEIRN